jgi:hypothetical protein
MPLKTPFSIEMGTETMVVGDGLCWMVRAWMVAMDGQIVTVPDTNDLELSTPGRAEADQSGTCTCPET